PMIPSRLSASMRAPLALVRYRLECGGEMSEHLRRIDHAEATKSMGVFLYFKHHFRDVINVGLGVGAARNRQSHELHRRVLAHHDRSDLAASHAAVLVQCAG